MFFMLRLFQGSLTKQKATSPVEISRLLEANISKIGRFFKMNFGSAHDYFPLNC